MYFRLQIKITSIGGENDKRVNGSYNVLKKTNY